MSIASPKPDTLRALVEKALEIGATGLEVAYESGKERIGAPLV